MWLGQRVLEMLFVTNDAGARTLLVILSYVVDKEVHLTARYSHIPILSYSITNSCMFWAEKSSLRAFLRAYARAYFLADAPCPS